MKKYERWTDAEIQILVDKAPTSTTKELRLLIDRGGVEIRSKLAELGIAFKLEKNRQHSKHKTFSAPKTYEETIKEVPHYVKGGQVIFTGDMSWIR